MNQQRIFLRKLVYSKFKYILKLIIDTWMDMISLKAAACWRACWKAADPLGDSFCGTTGDTLLEKLDFLGIGLDFPSANLLLLAGWTGECKMLALSTRWPEVSMSKSAGSRDGWCAICACRFSKESWTANMFFKTGFRSRFESISKSVLTWEDIFRPPSSLQTFRWTRSKRARALWASEKIKGTELTTGKTSRQSNSQYDYILTCTDGHPKWVKGLSQ